MRSIPSLAFACMALLAAGVAVAAGRPRSDDVVPFPTRARVEVDASGKVVQVTPDPALPAAFATAVRDTLATWTFVPPAQDGVAVGGTTYVQLAACAADVDGAVRLALKYQGNGPGRDLRPPQYPPAELRAGRSASVLATFRVEPDGRAVVEDVQVERTGKERSSAAFRAAVEQWIRDARFEPELVAGQPVATRLRYPLTFESVRRRAPTGPAADQDARSQERALNARTDTCEAALGRDDAQRAVSLDSPFRLRSSG